MYDLWMVCQFVAQPSKRKYKVWFIFSLTDFTSTEINVYLQNKITLAA